MPGRRSILILGRERFGRCGGQVAAIGWRASRHLRREKAREEAVEPGALFPREGRTFRNDPNDGGPGVLDGHAVAPVRPASALSSARSKRRLNSRKVSAACL